MPKEPTLKSRVQRGALIGAAVALPATLAVGAFAHRAASRAIAKNQFNLTQKAIVGLGAIGMTAGITTLSLAAAGAAAGAGVHLYRKHREKTAEVAEKKPFFKRRSTHIALGALGGAVALGAVAAAATTPLHNYVEAHPGRKLSQAFAGASRRFERLTDLENRSVELAMGHGYDSQALHHWARTDALGDSLLAAHTARSQVKQQIYKRMGTASKILDRSALALGFTGGGLLAHRLTRPQSEKTAHIDVPAGTGLAVLPRDLTRFMSDDDAVLVKRRAPHRRYDPGLLVRAVTRGAAAYGSRVKSRMKSQNEPLGHAVRYAAQDAGLGLRDFFLDPDLSVRELAEPFYRAMPVTAVLGTMANEGLRQGIRSTYGRDQTAKRAVQAVTAARFWDGATSGQPLRALLSDGRKTRRDASVQARQTPTGSPVRFTL